MTEHRHDSVAHERLSDVAAAYGVLAMVATDRPGGAAEIISDHENPAEFALVIAQAAIEMAYDLMQDRIVDDEDGHEAIYVPNDPHLDTITSRCRSNGRNAADGRDMPEYIHYPARFFPQLAADRSHE